MRRSINSLQHKVSGECVLHDFGTLKRRNTVLQKPSINNYFDEHELYCLEM